MIDSTDRSAALVRRKPLLRGYFHLGALIATLAAMPLLLADAHDSNELPGLYVYAFAMTALFGVSSAYHRAPLSPGKRRLVPRLDHTTIFLAIAGTYSAVADLVLHGGARVAVLLIVWLGAALGAALGIAIRQTRLEDHKVLVAIPYVVVGWSALAVL